MIKNLVSFYFFALLTVATFDSVLMQGSKQNSLISVSSLKAMNCKEKAIELNLAQADIVIAGVVRRLEPRHILTDKPYGAYIQIHRVIKGHIPLYDLLSAKWPNEQQIKAVNDESDVVSDISMQVANRSSGGSELKRMKKFSAIGSTVFVRNMGSALICNSKVKVNDYRVFLLRFDSDRQHLYLNSSVIQANLSPSSRLKSSQYQLEDIFQEEPKCKYYMK